MTEKDMKLTRLAAKAAGIDWWRVSEGWDIWNPLDDDGDALRLAIKLRIGLGDRDTTITAFYKQGMSSGGLYVEEAGEPYAATRRAIVRAAVEIGRQMENKK